ncbi:MAG: hypothetical protein MUF61_02405, partial [archaeon]|nr:hypothetical protein [archaeon]
KLTLVPKDIVLRFVADYEGCLKSKRMEDVDRLQANPVYASYGLFSASRRADLLKRMGIEDKPAEQAKVVPSLENKADESDNSLTDEERKFNQHYDICMTCKGMPASVVNSIFNTFDKTFSAPEYSQIYTPAKRSKLIRELGIVEARKK